jgi:outer membrane immunogenic protein
MLMKKVLLGTFALAALMAGPATAADLARPAPVYVPPPPIVVPIFSWTGCYIGGNVGGHWGKDNLSSTTDPVGWGVAGAAFIDGRLSPGSYNPDGFIGGIQGGCNLQYNSFVFGAEADADWLGGTTSRTVINNVPVAPPVIGDFMANSTNATFLSTVRARLGVAADRALFFVTGGAAFGTVKTTDSFSSFGGTVLATTSNSTTRTGWTVGGGLEYAFTGNWIGKIEYLYVNLGTFDAVIPSCVTCAVGSDITVHHQYRDNIVRVGLNYKFGGF